MLGPGGGERPALVFLSDFGLSDDSVAICKGVMLEIEPRLRIVDLTHQVRPYSVEDGARFLAGTAPFYPAGTVFVAVVDPGVGGTRKAIVVLSGRGQYFVLPDNGLITLVADQDGIRAAREITNPGWMRTSPSATFHGRDVFAPVGARLARGKDWTEVGPRLENPVRISLPAARADERGLSAEAIAVDGPYGNVVTNITADDFETLRYRPGDTVLVRLGRRELRLPFVRTFSDVPAGQALLYINSRGRLALAINQGSFAQTYRVSVPAPVFVPRPGR
jgi:S-adenosylmethionine hydrolase